MLSEFPLSLSPPEIFIMSVYCLSLENASIFHILWPNNLNSMNLSHINEICGQMKGLGFF